MYSTEGIGLGRAGWSRVRSDKKNPANVTTRSKASFVRIEDTYLPVRFLTVSYSVFHFVKNPRSKSNSYVAWYMSLMKISWASLFRQLINQHLSAQNEANHGQKSMPTNTH